MPLLFHVKSHKFHNLTKTDIQSLAGGFRTRRRDDTTCLRCNSLIAVGTYYYLTTNNLPFCYKCATGEDRRNLTPSEIRAIPGRFHVLRRHNVTCQNCGVEIEFGHCYYFAVGRSAFCYQCATGEVRDTKVLDGERYRNRYRGWSLLTKLNASSLAGRYHVRRKGSVECALCGHRIRVGTVYYLTYNNLPFCLTCAPGDIKIKRKRADRPVVTLAGSFRVRMHGKTVCAKCYRPIEVRERYYLTTNNVAFCLDCIVRESKEDQDGEEG